MWYNEIIKYYLNKNIMTTLTLNIPKKAEIFLEWNINNSMNISELFSAFWIDFDFILKEKQYSNEFLNYVKNNY